MSKPSMRVLSCLSAMVVLTGGYEIGLADNSEDLRIAETILLQQRRNGGWPKNYDRKVTVTKAIRERLLAAKGATDTTIDNGATWNEIRMLAKAWRVTKDARFRDGCLKGIAFLLAAQYDNGGWPQFYPAARGYAKHITFNDNAMTGAMQTLRAVAEDREAYPFADDALRARCSEAFRKGVACILKCQIVVDGRKTAWCAQHDEKTFEPRKARTYELASLSGAESVGIVRLLMSIDTPSPEIVEAVQGAVAWFDRAKIEGIRQIVKDVGGKKDKVVIKDPSAPPMWARFYTIGGNVPIFCSRDGVARKTLAEISHERRNGYSWLGYYPARLLAEDYPAWQKKWVPEVNVLEATGDSDVAPITIVIVGDSTVADYDANNSKRGWGQMLPEFLITRATVVNLAANGRSSKSFIKEGRWAAALARKPDFVLIQFGHNDCPGKGDRETDPAGDFRDYIRTYVRDARSAGAVPVLITPMTRRRFAPDGKTVVTILGPYAEGMLAVAREEKTPCIDLHTKSVRLLESLGESGSAYLNPGTDRTHFSVQGARKMAELIAEDLAVVEPALAPYVRRGPSGR